MLKPLSKEDARRRRLSAVVLAAFLGIAKDGAADTRGHVAAWHEPSEPGSEAYTTESLDLRGHARARAGVLGDWAYPPLAVSGTTLLTDRVVLHARSSVVLLSRVRVSAALPLVVYQHGDDRSPFRGPSKEQSFGDLRLASDVRLVGSYTSSARLAAGLAVYLPTGTRSSYTGDGVIRLAPRLMAAGNVDPFVWAVKVGYEARTLWGALPQWGGRELGDEVFFAASTGLKVSGHFVLGPELRGAIMVRGDEAFRARTTPLELLLGGRLRVSGDVVLGTAIGGGLGSAEESPALRVLALVDWSPRVEPNRP